MNIYFSPLLNDSSGFQELLSTITFEPNSNNIEPNSIQLLKDFKTFLNNNPKLKIVLLGNGDNDTKQTHLYWRRVSKILNLINNSDSNHRSRFIFQYGQMNDMNSVMIKTTDRPEPSIIPPNNISIF